MKNFTNNFKQFTSRLSARWLIMALMLLMGTSSAWGWSYKTAAGSWNCKGNTGWSNETLYTTPTGNTTQSLSVVMLTNPGSGFNILRADNCNEWNGSDHNHCLYVGLTGTASSSSSTIVRATAYWYSNGLYSKYTVVIPEGKIYIKPTGGSAISMTKDTYTYTAELTLSDAKTFDLYANDPSATIQNQWDMPSAGKPTSVRLNYTGLTSPYKYVRVSYNLKTNRITFTEMDPPCTPPEAPSLTNPDPQCGGFITLPASAEGVNLKWYDAQTGGNVVSDTEITTTGTYWAAAVTECESTSRTEYTVTINPIPEVNSLLSTLNICIGSIDETDLTTLSHVEVSSGSTAVWYTSKDGVEQAERANLINGGTYWVAAENSTTGCKSTTRTSFTINIKDLPQRPSLGKDEYETCAHASNTVSLNELAGVSDVIWYLGEEEVNEEVSIETAGIYTYTAKAVNANGCQSATGADFKLTVNSLPTITSISASNDKPVPFEDVVLTANNVTNGAQVNWYVGEDLVAENTNTYTVTSETAGEVIVKAKAFLGGCESAVASHTVNFSAEDCADVTTTKEETVGKIKLLLSKPSWIDSGEKFYCYAWENNTTNTLLGGWPGTELTQKDGNYYYVVVEANNKDIKIILNDKSEQTVDSDVLNANKIYQISATSSKNSDNKYTFNSKTDKGTYKESVTTTVPAPITTPAVKTVSVTSDEDGNVTMEGQVVKTGCDTQAILGLQYKKQNPDGTTYEANYTTYPNPGTKETISAGKTFTVTTKLEDGTYLVRARIDNSHATNGYGEDIKVVVNTTKTPISNVTLNYCDENGGNVGVDPNPMCKGATAYVRLEHAGSKYSDIKWLVEGVETNLVTDKGNGVVWSYIIQGTGQLSVELRNDANKDNEGNPTWATSDKLSFTMKAEPAAPYISIDPASGIICEGSEATIKVENNPSPDCSYKLVKEGSEEEFPPYDSGDLTYTVQDVGKYYVIARHNECTAYEYTSNQVAINQIIRTSAKISIEPEEAETTPWEPVTITVKPDAGYIYKLSYTDGNLAAVDGVRIKQNGDSYTYYIPRPDSWGTGNATSARETVNYGIEAQLKVDGEESTCKLKAATAIIQLKDEDNEDCD